MSAGTPGYAQLLTGGTEESAKVLEDRAVEGFGSGASALTERQKQILDWIVAYIKANQFSPSVREIRLAFGIKGHNAVPRHLEILAEAGYIERQYAGSRSLRVLRTAKGRQLLVVEVEGGAA